MQSDCNGYRDLLWSYVAGELSDSESEKIEKHLQGCPSCRQEAEELSLIVASLNEEIPLPPNFTQELHEKLISVSEELATEKPPVKETFWSGWKTLPRNRAFRTLAPALVCLVLAVGVFSTGLFDKWQTADHLVTDPSLTPDKPSSVSVVTKDDEPEDSTPSVAHKAVTQTPKEAPAPAAESEIIPETPPVVASDPAPADAEHSPAPASVEGEDLPATFAIPRHRPMIVCLTVANAEEFLNNWKSSSSFDWSSALQDIAPEELVSGVDPNTLVLKLNRTAFDSLMEYADTQEMSESQGETLIIFTEDGE